MPSPRGRRRPPKTGPKPNRKGPPSPPGHSINSLPPEQQRAINRARHTATLERLKKELDKCYRPQPNGVKVLWKRDEAAAIKQQMDAIKAMLEENQ